MSETRFSSANLPDGDWAEYRKVSITKAIQMESDFEVETIDGNIVRGHAGDYLCLDQQGHPYPCNRFEFACIYVPIERDGVVA